jgi:hypothetical protein
VAIQGDIGTGILCRDVGEELAAEAVLAGMEDSLAMIDRSDDREPLTALMKRWVGMDGNQETRPSGPCLQKAGGRFAKGE